MGWKGNGKFGVTTGRTVRAPFARTLKCCRGEEMVLKFTRGTGNLSSDELQDFLKENDIDDGLGDFNEFTTRLLRVQGVDRCCHVHYSLKKRKRWQLAEYVNQMEDTKQTAPNVTFIHRRVDRKRTADCFGVVRAMAGEVLQPKKRKYSKAQDLLKRSDKAELDPEVCYEMRYRYPRNEYPQCKEVPRKCRCSLCRWFDPNPGKALCKNKGAKNKGRRWGLYSDAELRSGHIKEKKPVLQQNSQKNTPGGKVQVVDSTEFRKCNDYKGSSLEETLDLGLYMLESSKTMRKQSKKNKHKSIIDSCYKF